MDSALSFPTNTRKTKRNTPRSQPRMAGKSAVPRSSPTCTMYDGPYSLVALAQTAQVPLSRASGCRAIPSNQQSYPSSSAASRVPSTRARIFAKAVSRAVERSSPKGEKPQSSVVPSWISGMKSDASSTRSLTSWGVSTFGLIGSITPTNTRRGGCKFRAQSAERAVCRVRLRAACKSSRRLG